MNVVYAGEVPYISFRKYEIGVGILIGRNFLAPVLIVSPFHIDRARPRMRGGRQAVFEPFQPRAARALAT